MNWIPRDPAVNMASWNVWPNSEIAIPSCRYSNDFDVNFKTWELPQQWLSVAYWTLVPSRFGLSSKRIFSPLGWPIWSRRVGLWSVNPDHWHVLWLSKHWSRHFLAEIILELQLVGLHSSSVPLRLPASKTLSILYYTNQRHGHTSHRLQAKRESPTAIVNAVLVHNEG